MVQFEKAKNGTITVFSNGVRLCSQYNPLEEARRFVGDRLQAEQPKTVVVLGETLGYIAQAVSDLIPGCRCIQVYYDPALHLRSSFRTDTAWHPKNGHSGYTFFNQAISELDLGNLTILEWAPSGKAFPEIARRSLLDLRRIISIYNGNIGTTALFGRRWLRNIVHNYLERDSVTRFKKKAGMAVIAAAGPTLESSIDALAEHRSSFYLIALPSSLSALLVHGLFPDLLVITDPGYYSAVHLTPAGRKKMIVAMPLSTVRDAGRYAAGVVLLNQGTYLEKAIFDKTAIPHLCVDSHGTVAGTAFFIARQIGRSIVFAGLDLTGRDIQTHVRPHAFDPLLEYAANRTIPSQTTRYLRGSENLHNDGSGGTGALEIYAGWFNNISTPGDHSIYRLNPSPVVIDGMELLDSSTFASLCREESSRTGGGVSEEGSDVHPSLSVQSRKSLLQTILSEAQTEIERFAGKIEPAVIETDNFTGPTPFSMIYFAATRTLLKGLQPDNTGKIGDAAHETMLFLSELKDYIQSWPV